jgi:hypothetical protein
VFHRIATLKGWHVSGVFAFTRSWRRFPAAAFFLGEFSHCGDKTIWKFHVLCKFEKNSIFFINSKTLETRNLKKKKKKKHVAQQALLSCIHILFLDYTGWIHPPGSICSLMTNTGTYCNCLATFKRSKLSRSLLVVAYELSSSFLSWPWISTLVSARLDIRSADCPSSCSICIRSIWSSLEVW